MPFVYDLVTSEEFTEEEVEAISREYEEAETALRAYETDIKELVDFTINASEYENSADLKGDYYNTYSDKVNTDANAWIKEANKLKDEFNNVFLPALASRIKEAETEKNNALKQHWEPDPSTP